MLITDHIHFGDFERAETDNRRPIEAVLCRKEWACSQVADLRRILLMLILTLIDRPILAIVLDTI